MDVWLEGDANNLPFHILFHQISGDKFPLFLSLLLQPCIKCGQIIWIRGLFLFWMSSKGLILSEYLIILIHMLEMTMFMSRIPQSIMHLERGM